MSANLRTRFVMGPPADREGRDGVNPWVGASPTPTSHLRGVCGKTCRRGAGPLATLAVVGGLISPCTFKFALVGVRSFQQIMSST